MLAKRILLRLTVIGCGLFSIPETGFAQSRISTSDPVTYSIRMTTSLRIPGKIETDRLRVWHALPPRKAWSLFTGEVGATGIQFSTGGELEYEAKHNSHHILWEKTLRLDPGETHRFLSQFEVRSMRRMLLPGSVSSDWEQFSAVPPAVLLSSEARNEEIHDLIQQHAGRIKEECGPYDAILAASAWIGQYLKYDAGVWFETNQVNAILSEKKGHCGHQATIFRQFCGAFGIPVRTIHGLNLYEEDGVGELHSIRPDFTNVHTWSEIYIPGIGWVEVEPVSDQNPFMIGSHLIRNNDWFQNYSIWVCANGEERQPKWTSVEGKYESDYQVEHLIEYRATPE
ncbi:MAG: transglutaminase-like domain-containing protein [Verrucomicrobiales bacterium]|nr:transglutaminase-like domain-containing protein [Verrucomicrobiales bacterium]